MREISAAGGFKSSRSAHARVSKLEESGYVERREKLARGVRLTAKGWEAAGEMPLMGRIAAGRGLEAVTPGEEAFSLVAELLSAPSGRERYVLRVVGQSMKDAGIEEDDLLVVEEDESPPNGEVVVALIGGGEEVTVKRLHREGDLVRLKPQNGDHQDIICPASEVEVQGKVVWVLHPPRP